MSNSYRESVKSSILIGGSSIISILVGVVRNKILALWLGTAGMGLMGLYTSIFSTAAALAGMGINSSGVKQIAQATGSGDDQTIARTAMVLRRVALMLGLIGAALVVIFRKPISQLTFGAEDYSLEVAALAIIVLFTAVSDGQRALIQGMRRVADLAKLNVYGAVLGTVISIPVIWYLKDRGVILFLILVSAAAILISWIYARKIEVVKISMTWREVIGESRHLLGLGFAFMVSALLATLTAYMARVIINRQINTDAAGLFQASWTLSSLYVNFVLQAMAADFYPRLTAAARDSGECNRLVNEQAEISLLLAAPGVVGTLVFAPFVLELFYSSQFAPAMDLLRWLILGVFLKVFSWPMGFIVLARGESRFFLISETSGNLLYAVSLYLGVTYLGLKGAGIAFMVQYAFNWCFVLFVAKRLTGFKWSPANVRLGTVSATITVAAFLAGVFLPAQVFYVLGSIGVLWQCIYSIRELALRLPGSRFDKLYRCLRISKAAPAQPQP